MSAEATIAARHALVILDAAAHVGVSTEDLLRAAQISAASLAGPDARIPLSAQARLWSEAVRLTGDESLGVRIGGSLSPGRLGILEPIILGSATVGDALERFIRFERLSADGVMTTLRLTERDAIVSHGPRTPGNPCSPHGIEVAFAAVLSIARSCTGRAFVPRAVRLKRSAPPDVAEHERVYRVTPRFGADDDALILDRASLATPFHTADPALVSVLERVAEHRIALLPPRIEDELTSRVCAWLRHAIGNGTPTMRQASIALAVSVRTMQRRLQREGTTFATLTDQVRRDLALTHARDHDAPIEVVALLAGFSEKRAFYRAFRRWTGVTPAVYRSGGSSAQNV
jgi:AraC-like DNA-binding protein